MPLTAASALHMSCYTSDAGAAAYVKREAGMDGEAARMMLTHTEGTPHAMHQVDALYVSVLTAVLTQS